MTTVLFVASAAGSTTQTEEPGRWAVGRVVDQKRVPISNAEVEVWCRRSDGETVRFATTSNEKGEFRVRCDLPETWPDTPAGDHDWIQRISAPWRISNYNPPRFQIQSNRAQDWYMLRKTELRCVQGRVVDREDNPVARAHVRYRLGEEWGNAVETNVLGQYEINTSFVGDLEIHASLREVGGGVTQTTVEEQLTVVDDLVLQGSHGIRGHLVNPDGEGLRATRVFVVHTELLEGVEWDDSNRPRIGYVRSYAREDGWTRAHTTTDGDGNFVVPALAPGEYIVYVVPENPDLRPRWTVESAPTESAQPGQFVLGEHRIALVRMSNGITLNAEDVVCQSVDTPVNPFDERWVSVMNTTNQLWPTNPIVTDDHIEFRVIPGQTYRVALRSGALSDFEETLYADPRHVEITATPYRKTVELDLQPGPAMGSLKLQPTGPHVDTADMFGIGVVDRDGDLVVHLVTRRPGVADPISLRPGVYRVHLRLQNPLFSDRLYQDGEAAKRRAREVVEALAVHVPYDWKDYSIDRAGFTVPTAVDFGIASGVTSTIEFDLDRGGRVVISLPPAPNFSLPGRLFGENAPILDDDPSSLLSCCWLEPSDGEPKPDRAWYCTTVIRPGAHTLDWTDSSGKTHQASFEIEPGEVAVVHWD